MKSDYNSITDHVALWFRWRWFLIRTVFITGIITFLFFTFWPKTYRSTATVLPPAAGGGSLPFVEGLRVDLLGQNEISPPALASLLKTRALKDRVQNRIDLMKHYGSEDLELAYRAFEDHLNVEMESEVTFGALDVIAFKIHIDDRDPEFTAQLVNVVVEEWDQLSIEINRRAASLRRQFLEDNIRQTDLQLSAVEDTLSSFQQEHGIASIEAQVQGTVTATVALTAKLSEARATVQILEKLLKPGHPDLQRARLELQSLLEEERKLLTAQTDTGVILPLGLAPELGLTITRLRRQIKTLEVLKEIMFQQFEQAKLRELRDTPELRIVDYGKAPLHKHKPKRLLLCWIACLIASFLAILYMYFKDYAQRVKDSEEYSWIAEISEGWQRDMTRLTRFWRRKS